VLAGIGNALDATKADACLSGFYRVVVMSRDAWSSSLQPNGHSGADESLSVWPTSRNEVEAKSEGMPSPPRPPRILVEPSDITLHNQGDTAMLCTALNRLRELWSSAEISVFSDEPDVLTGYCPHVLTLSTRGRYAWTGNIQALPLPSRYVQPFDRWLRRRRPELAKRLVRCGLRVLGGADADLRAYRETVARADLMLVAGMGGLTDAFYEFALALLDSMELALDNGVAVVMVGQGIGPIDDPRLLARAAAVLPRVDLFALREGRAGAQLLRSIGVPGERIEVTGDDAIELARSHTPANAGDGLGVNVRAESYAGIDSRAAIRLIGPVVNAFARRHAAPIVPAPITSYGKGDDIDIARTLFPDALDCRVQTPYEAIAQVARCRVVMAGSYHAAVFALSMGIPVVALAGSDYYRDKMLGLADMFEIGCRVEFVNSPDFSARLDSALEELWRSAPDLRPLLLASADRQIELVRAAYRRIRDIVNARLPAAAIAHAHDAL
jgi:polysaccharide pyruvyl transferase WcaK-like protein